MKQSKKRKRGGQLKPRQRKSSSLNLRVLDELKEQLEVASRRSGRTLSEEAAFRLTMSFYDEIQAVQRSLGDVMVEMLDKLGWRVGLEEVKHAISALPDLPEGSTLLFSAPIFIPPEVRRLLKGASAEISEGANPNVDQQHEGSNEVIDPTQVARSQPGKGATRTRTADGS